MDNVEVILVAPQTVSKTVGSGVFQSEEGIDFQLIRLEEYTTYYGKAFFRNINQIIDTHQPNIIISSWPYQLAWLFYPLLYLKIRRNKIKLISKEIPFQVPYYQDAIRFYTEQGGVNENNKSAQYDNSLLSKIKIKLVTEVRKWMVNRMDAHINYFDEAVEIHKSYGVNPEKVFVTANSPDTDYIFDIKSKIEKEASILPENPFRIIHVGRLVKWKNVEMLINAVGQLSAKYSNIELIVIGTGPEENRLKELVLINSWQKHVKFIGGVYEMTILGKYFKASSAYVLAGMGGLSINEAMAFGLPVICSVADGTEKKLVKEGVNGYYFENNNQNNLKEKIDWLLGDREKARAMGIESERIIREEININTVLKRYLDAFNFVLKK